MPSVMNQLSERLVLGMSLTNEAKMHQLITRGFPFTKLTQFLKSTKLPLAKVLPVLGLSESTYLRRKHAKRLSATESDKLWRVAKTHQVVLELFNGDQDAAVRWLLDPHYYFDDETPLNCLSTEPGAENVAIFCYRIMHGVLV